MKLAIIIVRLMPMTIFLSMPLSASAMTYLVTYKGLVSESTDSTGEFGVVGGTLDGFEFKAIFTLTYPLSGALFTSDSNRTDFRGGSIFGNGIPSPLSGSLTINGITKTVYGKHNGTAEQINDLSGLDLVQHAVFDNYSAGYVSTSNAFFVNISSKLHNIVNSSNIIDQLNYIFQLGDDRTGSFYFVTSDAQTTTFSHRASGLLKPISVSIAAVPEPTAWTLLLAGFGALGGSMRFRRVSDGGAPSGGTST